MTNGCVKTVYLPQDAAYYKAQWEDCQAKKKACVEDLETLKKMAIDTL